MTDPMQEDWRACERGELRRLRDEFPAIRRGVKLSTVLAALFCVLLVTAAWLGWRQAFRPDESTPAPTVPVRMACQQVRTLLQEYRNGQLAAPIRQRVAEHLKYCPGCRADYERLLALFGNSGWLATAR